MEEQAPEKPQQPRFRRASRVYRPIQSLFLIDILQDPDSRPALLYAGGTLLAGVIAYHFLEGWSYLDSLYFSVITLATVGYGDLTPTTPLAKIFTILYVINGIAILLSFFDRIRAVRSARIAARREDLAEGREKIEKIEDKEE
jgi:hypothetical protein